LRSGGSQSLGADTITIELNRATRLYDRFRAGCEHRAERRFGLRDLPLLPISRYC
jgi:hypothetical protein